MKILGAVAGKQSLSNKEYVGIGLDLLDKAPFIKMLEDGFTRGDLARLAAETSENATNIGLTGIAQTGIEYFL